MPVAQRCVMQEVAWRAGEPVDDRPRVTHPALALLAQQVHDRSSAAGRAALLAQVPGLTGAGSRDPRVGWALVEVCAGRALALAPPARVHRVAARLRGRAERGTGRWERCLRAPGAGVLARAAGPAIALARLADVAVGLRCVLAVAGPPGSAARDRALADLLTEATLAVRALGGAPVPGERALSPA